MWLLGLVMGGILGLVQGYALTPYYASVDSLDHRLLSNCFRKNKPAFPVVLIFIVVGALAGTALYLLPLTLIGVLTPEFRRTPYFPSWCWMFFLGLAVFRLKEARQHR
jgi:hypothetical protein